MLVAVWLIINTLQTNPVEAGAGLLLIALGLPFYLYYRRSAKPIVIAEAESGD